MTAMKDAYQKARRRKGDKLDDATRLHNEAEALLRKYNNSLVKSVLPFVKLLRSESALFTELAKQYLQRVSVDAMIPPEGAGAAQKSDDIPDWSGRPGETIQISGYDVEGYERRKPYSRTEEEKRTTRDATTAVAKTVLYSIMGRDVRNYRWYELSGLLRDSSRAAGENLRLSLTQAQDALVCGKLLTTYAGGVTDDTKLVHEIASTAHIREAARWAQEEAPKVVEMGIERYRKLIDAYALEAPAIA